MERKNHTVLLRKNYAAVTHSNQQLSLYDNLYVPLPNYMEPLSAKASATQPVTACLSPKPSSRVANRAHALTSLTGVASPRGSRAPSSALWQHSKPEGTFQNGAAAKKDDLQSVYSTAAQIRSPQPTPPPKASKPLPVPGKASARHPSLYLRDAEKYNRAHFVQRHLDQQVRQLQIIADSKHVSQPTKQAPKPTEPALLSVRSVTKKQGTPGRKASAQEANGKVKGRHLADKLAEYGLTQETPRERVGELGVDETQGSADAQTAEASVRTVTQYQGKLQAGRKQSSSRPSIWKQKQDHEQASKGQTSMQQTLTDALQNQLSVQSIESLVTNRLYAPAEVVSPRLKVAGGLTGHEALQMLLPGPSHYQTP